MSGADQEKIGYPFWDRPDPGFFWRRLLAAPKHGGTAFRLWKFWIWWSRPRSLRERVGAFRELVLSPFIAVLEAIRAARRYGPKVTTSHGISGAEQLWQLFSLRIRTGLPPIAYYQYSLFKPERHPDDGQYLIETGKLLQVLNRRLSYAPDLDIFVNKARFEAWCCDHEFPTVRNFLEIQQGSVVNRTVETLPPCDLFSKPSGAQAGEGVSRWTYSGGRGELTWVSEVGKTYSADELEAHLCARSREEDRPFVLQPRLRNHARIDRLANGSLSTIRLMTVRPQGGRAQPLLGALRLATGDSIADNFDLGGLGAPVDLVTGELGPAAFKRGEYPLEEVERHPDTGVLLTGEVLPFWEDCVSMCVCAHDAVLASIPVIGWDVAILEVGPVLIEANHMPGPQLAQMTTGIPLGATPFAECVLAAMRQAFRL